MRLDLKLLLQNLAEYRAAKNKVEGYTITIAQMMQAVIDQHEDPAQALAWFQSQPLQTTGVHFPDEIVALLTVTP